MSFCTVKLILQINDDKCKREWMQRFFKIIVLLIKHLEHRLHSSMKKMRYWTSTDQKAIC